MVLWRISNHPDLTGAGGMLASARWHSAGRPVVYLGENPAGALLEVLVHLEVDEEHRPSTYKLLRVEVDATVRTVRLESETLPADWTALEGATQAKGDAWLRSGTSALLQVPSAIVPETWNWLLNPRHPEAAKVRVAGVRRDPFDTRLL